MTLNVYNKLGLNKNSLTKVLYPLLELGDKIMVVMGTINLPFELSDEKYKREVYVEFIVVIIPLAYNVILKRLVLSCHSIVINIDYLCFKLLTLRESQSSNQKSAKNAIGISRKNLGKATILIDLLEELECNTKSEPADSIEEIELKEGKKVHFGTTLKDKVKKDLVQLLRN